MHRDLLDRHPFAAVISLGAEIPRSCSVAVQAPSSVLARAVEKPSKQLSATKQAPISAQTKRGGMDTSWGTEVD